MSIIFPAAAFTFENMGLLPMFNLAPNLINFSHSQPAIPIPLSFPSLHPYTNLNPFTLFNSRTLPKDRKFRKHVLYASSSSSSTPSPRLKEDSRALEALIFDCDGVILESEHLHRRAYNAAFVHFNVCCPPSSHPVEWDANFYDQLQNQIGGGKPKMRWYFNKNGWPTSNVFQTPPSNDSDKAKLIDILQDWKTEKYKEIIRSGEVKPRPGVLHLMDEVKASRIKLAVCSAATKSSVVLCLENLLGKERYQKLDCFLAGDDVQKKKPDPSIYIEAARKLGVPTENCLVIEDSVIGLQAAIGAGMDCVISYTSSTKDQDFTSAKAVYPDLENVHVNDLKALLLETVVASS